jgi:hypothetical protein
MHGLLTSPTTNQPGQVELVDVAPTVLALLHLNVPSTMAGRPMTVVTHRPGLQALDDLDRAAVFREPFAATTFWVMGVAISLLAIITFLVYFNRRPRHVAPLTAVSYLVLALVPAGHVLRAFEYWRFGRVGAHVALYALAAIFGFATSRIPGPRWKGGVALLLMSAAMFAADAFRHGPWQVNGVFGHSPVVAGRFYGIGNVGMTILYTSAILGLMALGDLRGWRAPPVWVALVFTVLIVAVGLPQFGANFGGILTGMPAAAVTLRVAHGKRVTWRWVAAIAALTAAAAMAAPLLDLLRPPEVRTHLGRFAQSVAAGGPTTLSLIVRRKIASQLGSFTTTRWTYFIPPAIAALGVLTWRPVGVLREVLVGRPMLRAGLCGTVVVGAVGFSVKDSGVSVPALALGNAICLLVLVIADHTRRGTTTAPETTSGTPDGLAVSND